MSEKKARPIVCTPKMVLQVAAGQPELRVPMSPQPPAHITDVYHIQTEDFSAQSGMWCLGWQKNGRPWTDNQQIRCPFGVPGDQLYVKEAMVMGDDSAWYYTVDSEAVGCDRDDEAAMRSWAHHTERTSVPAHQMPRWASRYLLTIADIQAAYDQLINAWVWVLKVQYDD